MTLHIMYAHLLFFLAACNTNIDQHHDLNANFGNYWYQGKAEIASYDLHQARYGQMRNGNAVLIFVTEDFSKSKQVKLDDPSKNKADAIKVLKLNATRKFITGIYPYSTMSSVFTPVYLNENPSTIKLSTSSQEWCGHTFLQANLNGNTYKIQGYSYFETEGDEKYEVENVLMEDEIWNRIRLNPKELPIGKTELMPGSIFCRFKHIDFKPYPAIAKMEYIGDTSVYLIDYEGLDRRINIKFNASFPHEILEWEEIYTDGGNPMTTKATLKKVIQLDYWNKNNNPDSIWREKLGLEN